MTKQVNSIEDFAEGLCEVDALPKAIYKGTDCGAWIQWDDKGIDVGSIVEGSDVDCTPIRLDFPTTVAAVWAALTAIDEEAAEIWEKWNDPTSEYWEV